MESTRIRTGETERIEVLVLNGKLNPLAGKTDILLSIRRVSDDYFYDFNDDTFKNSGWTTKQQQMTETSSVNASGNYHYNFDTSDIVNIVDDDTYEIRVDQDPGVDAANLPQSGEIKVGQYIDRLMGLSHENIYIDKTQFDGDDNLVSARVRTYSSTGSVGTSANVMDSYEVSASGDGPGKFIAWQQIKVL